MTVQIEIPFEDKIRLLVVDDHADTRALIARFFSYRGYDVCEAETGKQALQWIDCATTRDVVLLDVFIPDVGGMELLSQIRNRRSRPGVIVVSALRDRAIAAQAVRLGAFDYIQKPFNLSSLEATVVACLGHADYQSRLWWKRFIRGKAA
jgi:DNA-binding response OmpR family regulator